MASAGVIRPSLGGLTAPSTIDPTTGRPLAPGATPALTPEQIAQLNLAKQQQDLSLSGTKQTIGYQNDSQTKLNAQQNQALQEQQRAQQQAQMAQLMAQLKGQQENLEATINAKASEGANERLAALQGQQIGITANKDTLNQQAQLQSDAEKRRLAAMQGLVGYSSTTDGTGGPLAPVNYGDVTGAEDAARSAAFARAKDTAGQISRSAINGLNQTQAARGLNFSQLGANEAGGIINQQANQLGEVNRSQAVDAGNLARQRASEQYQGQIAQRGQNISLRGQQQQVALAALQNLTARAY